MTETKPEPEKNLQPRHPEPSPTSSVIASIKQAIAENHAAREANRVEFDLLKAEFKRLEAGLKALMPKEKTEAK